MSNEPSLYEAPAKSNEFESQLSVKIPLAATLLVVFSVAVSFPQLLVTFAAMTGFCRMWIVTGLAGRRQLSARSFLAALGTYCFFSTTNWRFSSPAGGIHVTWHGVVAGDGSTLPLIWHPCFKRIQQSEE